MNRRKVLGLLAGAVSLLVLFACGSDDLKADDASYKYKLMATVDTPEGERSGHSVIAVWWRSPNKKLFGSLASAGFTVKGEAVAVDLPDGQTMFVLLAAPNDQDWPAYATRNVDVGEYSGLEEDDAARDEWRYARMRDHREIYPIWSSEPPHDVPGVAVPYFVRFKDINDPKTVEQVDPNNLAASFGEGYSLKSLAIQMTGEPVTVGIEERLKWLEKMDEYDFDRDGPFNENYPPIVQYLRKNQ